MNGCVDLLDSTFAAEWAGECEGCTAVGSFPSQVTIVYDAPYRVAIGPIVGSGSAKNDLAAAS